MADVTLSYKGSDILELSDSGSATLKTGGKYCEDDIELEYVKPSGGGSETRLEYTIDDNGDIQSATLYGNKIPSYMLITYGGYPFKFLNPSTFSIANPNDITTIGANACNLSVLIPDVSFPNCVKIGAQAFMSGGLATNQKVVNVYLPKVTSVPFNCFTYQRNMTTAQFGSVGYTVTTFGNTALSNCNQSNLIVTVYTSATYLDTILANVRNGATNATIVIKASEETTYNGTTYNAGDTILTSEVT